MTTTATLLPPLASCFPSLLANASRGAVAIFAPLSRDLRSLATCSGALVAAAGRRGRPLILTADHCLRGGGGDSSSGASSPSSSSPPSPLSTLDLWTFAFGYGIAVESTSGRTGGGGSLFLPCGSSRLPPPPQVVQGAALRWFSRGGSDVALLELPGGIPASFGAYALGFDAVESPPRVEVFSEEEEEGEDEEGSGNDDGRGGRRDRQGPSPLLPSSSLVALHFPGGGPARASFVREITSQFYGPERGSWRGSSSSSSSSPLSPSPPTAATHWRARYFGGGGGAGTSRGSSGAPLIDLSTGRVVAVLTGGSLLNNGDGGGGRSSGGGCERSEEEESPFDFFGTLASAWRAGASTVLSPPSPSSSPSSSPPSLGGAPGFDPAALSSADQGPRLGFSPSALLIASSSSAARLDAFLSRSLGSPGGGSGRSLRVSLSVAPIPSGDEALKNESSAAAGEGVSLFPSGGFALTDATPSVSIEVRDAAPGRPLPAGGRRFYVVASAREQLSGAAAAASSGSPGGGGKGAGSGSSTGSGSGASAAAGAGVGGPARDELGMKVVVSSAPKAGYGELLARKRGRLGNSPPFDLRSNSSSAELKDAGLAAFWWNEREEKNETGNNTSSSTPPPSWDVSVCLLPPLLPDAAVALYADGSLEALASGTDFSWRDRRRNERGGGFAAAGADNNSSSGGDSPPSACFDVARGISFPPGARIDLVVSDSDFLNQALSAGAVTRLTVARAASTPGFSASGSSGSSSAVPSA